MKLVFVTQWFPPEQAPIGHMLLELAESLVESGHQVIVVTGFPNHPSGNIFEGFRKRWCEKTKLKSGVELWRVYLFTSPYPNRLQRMFTFLTFTLTSAWTVLLCPKVDIIYGVFQPLSVGLTLPIISKIKRTKLVLNVQDLHPDAAIELGLVRNRVFIKFLYWVESFGYRMSNGLTVICNQFRVHCINRGANGDVIEVIPNWIDVDEITSLDRNNDFRQSIGLSERHLVVLFAGTIGMVAGAEVVLRAAKSLNKDLPNVRFVFVGEGPALNELKNLAFLEKISNVLFFPFQNREILSQVQSMSDVSLVTMKLGKGRASVPSKVLGYMAAARPVVASVDLDSETANLIRESSCGKVVAAEDPEALAIAVKLLCSDESLRKKLGDNGRRYLEQNFRKENVTSRYARFFERIMGRK